MYIQLITNHQVITAQCVEQLFAHRIEQITARAFARANLIHKCFVLRQYQYTNESVYNLRAPTAGVCVMRLVDHHV